MKRKITSKLYEWKNIQNGRMPLLIYGARQVGKTFEMREFGALYYKNTVYVNFETDERIGKYFETDIHADHVIAVLQHHHAGLGATNLLDQVVGRVQARELVFAGMDDQGFADHRAQSVHHPAA